MSTNDNERRIRIPNSAVPAPGKCTKCGSLKFEMRNYMVLWQDGDIHCADCGEFFRSFGTGK
jgi:hypothetical protein